ncbi:hypothetical protein [Methanococcus maripaludis]|uniref:Uncharacterized protein n=1 Tax=Methanococcus maripaludis TaxID=39152 RepID=A0A2L1C8F1_METMI|nr:hypothetical protein [Methanococcus maripaludis]AVB75652.1 hypothetical protein MMJJ_02330 [Methanococcus maripaludis]
MEKQVFLNDTYNAFLEVFNTQEQKYVSNTTRLMKLFICTAEELGKLDNDKPIAYGWYNHGLFCFELYNDMNSINEFRKTMDVNNNLNSEKYELIKSILKRLKPHFLNNTIKFDKYIHEELPDKETKKYYRAVNEMECGFERIQNENSGLGQYVGEHESKNLQKCIGKLEKDVIIEYNAEKRNDVFWEYTDSLYITLDNYENGEQNLKSTIKNMGTIFTENLLSIISPYPETLSGHPELLKIELKKYDESLKNNFSKFRMFFRFTKSSNFLKYDNLLKEINNAEFTEKTYKLINEHIYPENSTRLRKEHEFKSSNMNLEYGGEK